MTTCWIHVDYMLTTCWLHVVSMLSTCWVHVEIKYHTWQVNEITSRWSCSWVYIRVNSLIKKNSYVVYFTQGFMELEPGFRIFFKNYYNAIILTSGSPIIRENFENLEMLTISHMVSEIRVRIRILPKKHNYSVNFEDVLISQSVNRFFRASLDS